MQIHKPQLYTKTEANRLKSHYETILIGKRFGSEYYSKVGRIELIPHRDKFMVKVFAHDKDYFMDLETCLTSLELQSAKEYLELTAN